VQRQIKNLVVSFRVKTKENTVFTTQLYYFYFSFPFPFLSKKRKRKKKEKKKFKPSNKGVPRFPFVDGRIFLF
jgi:hypothetical protein